MPVTPAPKKNNQNDLNIFLNANFNLLVVFIVVIFLAAAYFLMIKPKFEITLVAIRDNIAQQEQFYQGQRQKLADLKAAADLYHQIDDNDIARVNAVLPNEYAKEKLFGELEDILLQKGLILSSMYLTKLGEGSGDAEPLAAKDQSILSIPNAAHVGVIQAEMSLLATDYSALKNLLPLIEGHLQLIDIQSLTFDPAEKTAQITFYTYYFK
jgi:hypothetical protein